MHGIVPSGGLSPDGERWIACRPGFFLPLRVLSRLFRHCFLEALDAAHRHGQLQFFSEYAGLADPAMFDGWLAPLRACEWGVYAERLFAGPEAVLAYLSSYTHRVAISNQRLISSDERGVTFRWKDYRAKGRTCNKTMTLEAGEFMRHCTASSLRQRASSIPPDHASINTAGHPGPSIAIAPKTPTVSGHSAVQVYSTPARTRSRAPRADGHGQASNKTSCHFRECEPPTAIFLEPF
ncbi:hypothetical protein R70199_06956 [Paraburkholderia domus]|nr:hypothetical protein R70199_06956 [Paraburkholderia domus]